MIETNVEEAKVENSESQKFFGLKYDRVFKTIICIKKNNKGYYFLERLIKEVTHLDLKVLNILSPELPVKNTSEKTKRMDLLVECDGAYVLIELNSVLKPEIIVRNEHYFSAFISNYVHIGEVYNTNVKFIQISLSFNINLENDLVKTYYTTARINKVIQELFMYNIRKIHINLDNWKKVWYDNVAKKKMKGSLLTLISLKKKEDILEYAKLVDDPLIKECVDEIMKLNDKEDFVKSFWPYTEEEEDEMLQKAFAERMRREGKAAGIAEGKAAGIAEGKAAGIIEGKAAGIAEGKAAGIAEGKAAGIAEGKAAGEITGKKMGIMQTAKNMLKEKCDINLISKVTKLSKTEIKTLM